LSRPGDEDVVLRSRSVQSLFTGRSGATPTLLAVIPGELAEPQTVDATDAFGASTIDAVVASRRAELDRWVAILEVAHDRCALAELALAEGGCGDAPDDMLAVVDAMLARAMDTANHSIELARAEAAATVSEALRDAIAQLRSIGQDPAAVLRSTAAPSGVDRDLDLPPTASDLWRECPRAAAVESHGQDARRVHPSGAVATSVAVASRHAHRSGSPTVLSPPAAPVPEEEATSSSEAASVGEVYEMFWQEVPGQGRVRDRLLRRPTKEGS
jgi:hypothetical protein